MTLPSNVSAVDAMTAGAVSTLSACALPVLPAFFVAVAALTVATRAPESSTGLVRATVGNAIACAAGFTILFVAIATAAPDGGVRLVRVVLERGGGIALIGLGTYLALRRGRAARAPIAQAASRAFGVGGALIAGAVIGSAWTPCIGPTLASILLSASIDGVASRGSLLVALYSMTLALPLATLAGAGAGLLLRHGRGRTVRAVAALGALSLGAALAAGRMVALTGYLAQFAPLLDVGG